MKAARHLRMLATTARLRLSRLPEPSGEPPRKVLVLGYAAIGDFLMFQPVLEALRRGLPKARLVFLANPSPVTEELLPASRLVDEVWLHDWEGPKAARTQAAINARVAEYGFDAAVLTLSSPAHYFQKGLSRIPLRAGHLRPAAGGSLAARARRALVTGEPARRALLNRPAPIGAEPEYALRRNLRLLGAFGLKVPAELPRPALPIPPADRAWAERELAALPMGRKKVGLHLGPPGNQYFKMWDPARFGALCARLAERHAVEFVVVGDASDAESLRRARAAHPLPHSWIGRASLLRSFALIERCALFLSNDTGPAKAAAALGVPTATLMGPTEAREVGAPWDRERHLEIDTGIACRPCVSLGMAKTGQLNYLGCGHHDCLGKLEVEAALSAIERRFGPLL
jgi:ADP-heptose:LPS heptosyltransferase